MDLNLKATITISEKGTLRALAAMTVNEAICIKSIALREGRNGIFVSMPRIKKSNGKYEDIVFPITAEYRTQINDFLITEYKRISGGNIDEK